MKRIIALMLACILALSMTGCSSDEYEQAVNLYNAGRYAEAEQILTELGDYKDSIQLRLACRYAQAMELYENASYTEAGIIFKKLGTYEDSSRMLSACYYAQAAAQQEAGEYAEALELYQKAAGYEDSDEKAVECREQYAAKLMADGAYDKALPQLKALKKLGALENDSNAIGWCTLAAYLQENRGFSNVQTYAFSMRLTQESTIEILAHMVLEEEDQDGLTSTVLVDYSVTVGLETPEAPMSYTYSESRETKVSRQVRTVWGKEEASATASIADFTAKKVEWDITHFEGKDEKGKDLTQPLNAMTEIMLTKLYREMNLALAETELDITLRDLGFISLAV